MEHTNTPNDSSLRALLTWLLVLRFFCSRLRDRRLVGGWHFAVYKKDRIEDLGTHAEVERRIPKARETSSNTPPKFRFLPMTK